MFAQHSESIKYAFAIKEFHKNIVSFTLFPKWASGFGNGYGYPLFIFSPPLFFFLAEPFALSGISPFSLLNIISVLTVFCCAISMFRLSEDVSGIRGGLISSLIYLFSPSLISILFNRNNFDDIYSFLFLPLSCCIAGKSYKIEEADLSINTKHFIKLSFCCSLLFLSSKPTFMMTLSLLLYSLFYHFIVCKNKRPLRFLLINSGGIFTGLWLSAFFWFQAALEAKYIYGNDSEGNIFLPLILPASFFISFLAGLLFKDKSYNKPYKLRLLTIISVLIIFIGGAWNISDNINNIKETTEIYEWQDTLPYSVGQEYMPIGVKKMPDNEPRVPLETISGKLGVLRKEISPSERGIRVKAVAGSATVRLNLFYFPGWTLKIKDIEPVPVPFTVDDTGRIIAKLPEGVNFLRVTFDPTIARIAGELISFTGLLFCLFLFIYKKEKK